MAQAAHRLRNFETAATMWLLFNRHVVEVSSLTAPTLQSEEAPRLQAVADHGVDREQDAGRLTRCTHR